MEEFNKKDFEDETYNESENEFQGHCDIGVDENYLTELEKELRMKQIQEEILYIEQSIKEGLTNSKNERHISDDLIKYIIDLINPNQMSRDIFDKKFESMFKYYIDIIKKYC